MASLRNLVITILRLSATTSIATAPRYHARRPSRPLQRCHRMLAHGGAGGVSRASQLTTGARS
jgi:hypothetical protein